MKCVRKLRYDIPGKEVVGVIERVPPVHVARSGWILTGCITISGDLGIPQCCEEVFPISHSNARVRERDNEQIPRLREEPKVGQIMHVFILEQPGHITSSINFNQPD